MPRRASPPRLYLRDRRGREPTWVILDRAGEIGTGAGKEQRVEAETALASYINRKYQPRFGQGDPHKVLIADVLADYSERHGPQTRRPQIIGSAVDKLVEFFSIKPVATLTASTCNDYAAWRIAQTDGRAKRSGRLVKAATARRELVVLSAALRFCWREGRLDRLIPISLPAQSEPRERHLTRKEAARLLWGAIGFDGDGDRDKRRINRHLARFILLGLYTGTRHSAILKLQWLPNTTGGWVDLKGGILYRRPEAAIESGKRRPAIPIPPRLLPHLKRWKRLTARYLIEWKGNALKGKERRSWATARKLAGLGVEVTPHILRHTCATWLLQAGVSAWDTAGVLGTTEAVIRGTYGHHAKDHLREAVAAFSRPRLAQEIPRRKGSTVGRRRRKR